MVDDRFVDSVVDDIGAVEHEFRLLLANDQLVLVQKAFHAQIDLLRCLRRHIPRPNDEARCESPHYRVTSPPHPYLRIRKFHLLRNTERSEVSQMDVVEVSFDESVERQPISDEMGAAVEKRHRMFVSDNDHVIVP